MTVSSHVLAIDQGTTNSKVLLMDGDGRVVASGSCPVPTLYPKPGWVEQDACALWNSVRTAIDACLAAVPGVRVAAIGISNQRESLLAWDRKTGAPLGPCITWQCRRSTAICDDLKARGLSSWLEERTGLTIDPLFSASKARWLLDTIPDGQARAAQGEICLGNVDAWLLWNLTGGAVHATDLSNASRTQLLNLQSADWDSELLAVFGVPRAALPQLRPTSGFFGETVAQGQLAGGIPVMAMAGDSHAALFGHGVFAPGAIKATYGTGSSLMTLTGAPRDGTGGVSRTIAWQIGGAPQLAMEGNIASTGATLAWTARLLGLGQAQDAAHLGQTVPDAADVYIVPAFNGLGAPYWDDHARGLISGLTQGATGAHLCRAAMESTVYQVADLFEAMQGAVGALDELRADGGASRNDMLMQFQADILDKPVVRDRSADLSARGAAWLAGLAQGMWKDVSALAALPREIDRFEPRMSSVRRTALYRGWKNAVQQARLRGATEDRV